MNVQHQLESLHSAEGGRGVLQDLDRTLTAVLARTLEFDPALSGEDAVRRVAHIAEEAGLLGLDERLRKLVSNFRQRGVINPHRLFQDEIRPHFFLANGRPGLLSQVIRDSEQARPGVSQYVVYGHWDSLLILYGSADEASRLMARLAEGAYEDSVRFSAQDVLLAYRHRIPDDFTELADVATEDINELALDYDNKARRDLRESLLKAKILLGPTLTLDAQSPYPITAFVGITVKTRASISGPEVLDALMRQEDLHRCIVDLFEITQGVPFHYFAKIACASVDELDGATTAVAFASHGGIRFEGETLVVAQGSEQLPLVRKPDVATLMIAPDIGAIVRVAQRIFDGLEPAERISFNSLADERQLATLRALAGLQASIAAGAFDATSQERIVSAVSTFARESTKSDGGPNLTGAVIEVASMVEILAKTFLSRLAYSVCGNDPAMIQRELKLPTRKIRSLSLGKVVQALRTAAAEKSFSDALEHLPEEWIDRLAAFSDERNFWAHGAVRGTGTQMVDHAFGTMREGIAIATWLEAELKLIRENQARARDATEEIPGLNLSARPPGSDFSVFVSHASADGAIAERIAMGLQAMGYNSWYAEWELKPGDSIVDRIQAALSASDVLLVVLSQRSVVSGWVQRELSAVLMAQLSGQSVLVVPVLIETCEIPPLLADTLYVDLRDDFEVGFLKLLDALRRHRSKSQVLPGPSSAGAQVQV